MSKNQKLFDLSAIHVPQTSTRRSKVRATARNVRRVNKLTTPESFRGRMMRKKIAQSLATCVRLTGSTLIPTTTRARIVLLDFKSLPSLAVHGVHSAPSASFRTSFNRSRARNVRKPISYVALFPVRRRRSHGLLHLFFSCQATTAPPPLKMCTPNFCRRHPRLRCRAQVTVATAARISTEKKPPH